MTVSAADIEAMVEKKVSEVLAARAAAERKATPPSPVQVQPDLNDAVQRRLEALEKRIESEEWRDDGKSEGLRHLLAARQHKEKGDDTAALEAYEMALPFFPGQTKLVGKIERLRIRLGITETPRSPRSAKKKQRRRFTEEDADYDEAEADVEGETFSPVVLKKTRRPRTKVTATPLFVEDEPPCPQAQLLLDIVNSRDLDQIRSLVGFGAKKAKDLVDYLELVDQEDGGRIETLAHLRTVPGIGGRAVERAYEGLMV